MFFFQRLMALLMAAAMLIFVLPIALARRNYAIAALVAGVFFLYVAFNAWLFIRTRASRP